MKSIAVIIIFLLFFSNIIWSIFGVAIAFLHIPYLVSYNHEYSAVVIRVRDIWILDNIPGYEYWRWIALWNIVILNPREEKWDELHECIHVEQFMRYPGIFPILNIIQTYKNGYSSNPFEVEAYSRAGNIYYP